MPSVLWSGKPKTDRRREVRLSIEADPLSYELGAGLPPQAPGDPSSFLRDPDIKDEAIWATEIKRPSTTLMERAGPIVNVVDAEGVRRRLELQLNSSESVLSQLRQPEQYPELTHFQQRMSRWRFYHQFRTDADSPMRRPQVGCRTPVLSHDGRDLAAAYQTIRESGREMILESILAEAFPDGAPVVEVNDGWFSLGWERPGLRRPLAAHEFSDGTLRFLCLAVALLTPDPPELIILNEPETSLNPSLILPLARLVLEASQTSQVWVTTHSEALARELAVARETRLTRLTMVDGETKVKGKETVVFEADED